MADVPLGYPDVMAAMPETIGSDRPVREVLSRLGADTLKSLWSTVTGPGQLMQPNPYPAGSEEASWYDDQRQRGAVDWGREAAFNLAGIGSTAAEPGAAGIFGGRLAKTADQNALRRAEEMHAAGADRNAIWDQTGWFKGGDDKWRFEIPDDQAQMKLRGVPVHMRSNMTDLMYHEPLFNAYPDLRNTLGVIEKDTPAGSYVSPKNSRTGTETINIQGPDLLSTRSTALHELQHAVQEREGFARGGSPAMFGQQDEAALSRDALSWRREMDRFPGTMREKDAAAAADYKNLGATDWMPNAEARKLAMYPDINPDANLAELVQLYGLDKQTTPHTSRDLYRSIPGEVEARNVQTRQDLTPAQRSGARPWETLHWMDDAAASPALNKIFSGRVGMLEGPAMSIGGRLVR